MEPITLYTDFLKQFLTPTRPLKVLFDCSNGTTGMVLEELFKTHQLINSKLVNSRPDGNFPAHGPNPWNEATLKTLGEQVIEEKADCGIIFDADGDRVFFVDNLGRTVLGDHAAILIGMAFEGPVILDLRMGYTAREWFTSKHREVIDSRVGHSFIKQLMREKSIPYAAELSGHYYFKDFFYCDSGIFAAIQFLNNLPARLSEWVDSQPKYYQSGEINFVIPAKAGIQEANKKEEIMKKIETHFKKEAQTISHLDGLKMEFDGWWMNVRPSNTENLLRLNLEAKEKGTFEKKLNEIKKLIERN